MYVQEVLRNPYETLLPVPMCNRAVYLVCVIGFYNDAPFLRRVSG